MSYTVQFAGSEEKIKAPSDCHTPLDAARWAGLLFHPSCAYQRKIGADAWLVTNRRRGMARRGTMVAVYRGAE